LKAYLVILGILLIVVSTNNTKVIELKRPISTHSAGKVKFHARVVWVSPQKDRGVLENVNTKERIDIALNEYQSLTEYGKATVAITDRMTLIGWEKVIDQHYIGVIEDVKGVYAIINGHPYKIKDRGSLLAGRKLIGRRAFGTSAVIRTSG
jgi:hypothetical protein